MYLIMIGNISQVGCVAKGFKYTVYIAQGYECKVGSCNRLEGSGFSSTQFKCHFWQRGPENLMSLKPRHWNPLSFIL